MLDLTEHGRPSRIVSTAGRLFLAVASTVLVIDPSSFEIIETIPVGLTASELEEGDRGVFARGSDHYVWIDPDTLDATLPQPFPGTTVLNAATMPGGIACCDESGCYILTD